MSRLQIVLFVENLVEGAPPPDRTPVRIPLSRPRSTPNSRSNPGTNARAKAREDTRKADGARLAHSSLGN